MQESIVVARDPGAQRLVLLFHGVGAGPASLQPLGRLLARRLAPAWVVCVAAAFASDRGEGRQWFSVRGIGDDNRAARAAAAMPPFIAAVNHWQAEAGLGPAETTLLGFSQGAIMALESMQTPAWLSGRVIALAGRFATDPQRLPTSQKVNLIHGDADPVIPSSLSQRAFESLARLGADVTLDRIPRLGHTLDERTTERILYRLGS